MEKTKSILYAAQIPAWLEVLTGNLEEALRQPLEQQQALLAQLEQALNALHDQISNLNQGVRDLMDVQLTQVETLQDILERKRRR